MHDDPFGRDRMLQGTDGLTVTHHRGRRSMGADYAAGEEAVNVERPQRSEDERR
jgi:hypothetical protein